MSRIQDRYPLVVAALVVWPGPGDFGLLRRLIWFAWVSEATTEGSVSENDLVVARRSLLRGLSGWRKWRLAFGGGVYVLLRENRGRVAMLLVFIVVLAMWRLAGFLSSFMR